MKLTTHLLTPMRMKGWVGLVGWHTADGLTIPSAAGPVQTSESSPVSSTNHIFIILGKSTITGAKWLLFCFHVPCINSVTYLLSLLTYLLTASAQFHTWHKALNYVCYRHYQKINLKYMYKLANFNKTVMPPVPHINHVPASCKRCLRTALR